MPSEWISHVKQFQAQHGCSYKDALQGASASYRSMKGSGVNRLKKAERWTDYADSTLHRGLNTAHKAQKLFGSGVNRLKKAERWTDYADSTLHRGLNTAHKAQKLFGSGLKKHKRHQKLSGQALYVA